MNSLNRLLALGTVVVVLTAPSVAGARPVSTYEASFAYALPGAAGTVSVSYTDTQLISITWTHGCGTWVADVSRSQITVEPRLSGFRATGVALQVSDRACSLSSSLSEVDFELNAAAAGRIDRTRDPVTGNRHLTRLGAFGAALDGLPNAAGTGTLEEIISQG